MKEGKNGGSMSAVRQNDGKIKTTKNQARKSKLHIKHFNRY